MHLWSSRRRCRMEMEGDYFGNAKGLVAGRTEEFCEQQGLRIISSCTHRHRMESPNDSSVWLPMAPVPCFATRTSRYASGMKQWRHFRTPTKTNEGTTPCERFYGTNRT